MPRKKSQRKRAEEAAATQPAAPTKVPGQAAPNSGAGLSINREYAEQYEAVKRRQEVRRLRDQGVDLDGNDDDDGAGGEDDSDEEDEDEHAELLTRRVDKEISATLEKIRARDPAIYDPATKFYTNDAGGEDAQAAAASGADGDPGSAPAGAATGTGEATDSEDSSYDSEDEPVAGWDAIARSAQEAVQPKRVFIKDYVRETLLADGKLDSDDDQPSGPAAAAREAARTAAPPALYNDEQVALKQSLLAAGESSDGETDGGDSAGDASGADSDDFFTVRKKTSEDVEAEEADFAAFQVREGAVLAREDGEQRLLHAYLENETPDEKEYFLREFVLNNGWLGGERHKAPRHGDYTFEVDKTNVGAAAPAAKAAATGAGEADDAESDDEGLDDDQAFVDTQEMFEYGHNFRFEDAGAAEVVSHARQVAGSLRRKSDSRRRAREARRAAKVSVRMAAVEEVKRQKNVLRDEIDARKRELEAAAGAPMTNAEAFDLDGDWDVDAYAKAMEAQFGDDYYAAAAESEADIRKGALPEETGGADEDAATAEAAVDAQKKSKKGKQAAASVVAVAPADPLPADGKLASLVDQYHGLDFEDIVGGQRLRFNYRQVPKDTFGLSMAEVLEEEDKDLNRKVSLRFYAPYRDKRSGPKRSWQQDKRSRGILHDGGGADGHAPTLKAKGKRTRSADGQQDHGAVRVAQGSDATTPAVPPPSSGDDKSKKQKRKHSAVAPELSAGGVSGPGDGPGAAQQPVTSAGAEAKPKKSKHSKQRKKRDQARQAASSSLPDSRLKAYAL